MSLLEKIAFKIKREPESLTNCVNNPATPDKDP
jgi:hypothetical protein